MSCDKDSRAILPRHNICTAVWCIVVLLSGQVFHLLSKARLRVARQQTLSASSVEHGRHVCARKPHVGALIPTIQDRPPNRP